MFPIVAIHQVHWEHHVSSGTPKTVSFAAITFRRITHLDDSSSVFVCTPVPRWYLNDHGEKAVLTTEVLVPNKFRRLR